MSISGFGVKPCRLNEVGEKRSICQYRCSCSLNHSPKVICLFIFSFILHCIYRGADKSLSLPGRKQGTATEDFEFHISYL